MILFELILKGQIVWKAGVLFFSFLELPETRVMVASGLLKDFFSFFRGIRYSKNKNVNNAYLSI
jgi:hypothetical protein